MFYTAVVALYLRPHQPSSPLGARIMQQVPGEQHRFILDGRDAGYLLQGHAGPQWACLPVAYASITMTYALGTSSSARALPLIPTGLLRPRIGDDFVSRSGLLRRLDQGLGQKLALVSAPAGYGRSTLLARAGCHIPVAGPLQAQFRSADAAVRPGPRTKDLASWQPAPGPAQPHRSSSQRRRS